MSSEDDYRWKELLQRFVHNKSNKLDNKSIPTISISQYMYTHDMYIISDNMAISHSNHLFVPVAFVFYFLSLFIHTNSYGKQPILYFIQYFILDNFRI